MVQALDHTRPALARVEEGTLVLEWLEEDDPVVLRVVSDADDVEQAARSCLEVGARALVAGHAALDEDLSVARLIASSSGSMEASIERSDGSPRQQPSSSAKTTARSRRCS